ncbi:MAG: transporter, family, inorganic phosphate transporter [Acidimicrobiaceae bacterium]|nr:transporter, family, inorganic phosphate transporter [Acidimicrobiaceae bacterium]
MEGVTETDSSTKPSSRPPEPGQVLDDAPIGRFHFRTVVAAGIGFFTDAYDLFVIGTVLTLLKGVWHLDTTQISLVSSVALLAAFFGAFIFGRIADVVGRRKIFVAVAVIMIVGSLASALSPNLWFLIGARFVLGLGIGGDYPVSAVLTSEFANRSNRGRLVGLVFSMQALGLVVGPLVGLTLVASGMNHDLAWRLMLGIGCIPAAAVVVLRLRMPESPRFASQVQGIEATETLTLITDLDPGLVVGTPATQAGVEPEDLTAAIPPPARMSLKAFLTNRHWMLMLLGTAGTWFLFDYAYYGNSISTPLIIHDVAPHATLVHSLALTVALFVIAAVPGYILAFMTMDRIGHRRLQVLGFSVMGGSFLLLGLVPSLTTVVGPFLVIYGISYFFSEFGPNTTTFVMPAEIFPVSVRTTGHGLSAGIAKLGAFIGVYLFPIFKQDFGLRGSMLIAGAASIGGMLLTFVLPETAGRSLEELSDHGSKLSRAEVLTEPPESTPPLPTTVQPAPDGIPSAAMSRAESGAA